MIGANQFRCCFIREWLTAFLEQGFIAGDIRGIHGTGAEGASPIFVARAHSTVHIALVIALETAIYVFRIRGFLARTRMLQLDIQVHVLAQGGFFYPDFVVLK